MWSVCEGMQLAFSNMKISSQKKSSCEVCLSRTRNQMVSVLRIWYKTMDINKIFVLSMKIFHLEKLKDKRGCLGCQFLSWLNRNWRG